MKKYALLIGIVWSFVSCSADELEATVQTAEINNISSETTPTSDPKKDWDKDKHNDNNSSNDGN